MTLQVLQKKTDKKSENSIGMELTTQKIRSFLINTLAADFRRKQQQIVAPNDLPTNKFYCP
jgi:hypothetical protein